jgi:hypothetical protein
MDGDVFGEGAAVGCRHDPLPRRPSADLVADRFDHPHGFLAGDERRRAGPARKAVALHDIAPAQARVLDPDQHLPRPWLGPRRLAQPQVLGPAIVVDEDRLHALAP